jgi:hypothetical protein
MSGAKAWRTVPAAAGPPPVPGPRGCAPEWDVLSASARGSVHARSGAPLQDATGWWPGPGVVSPAGLVVAVSDGVGSRDCFRSDRGARIAVEAACAVGAELLERGLVTEDGAADLMAPVVGRGTAGVRADLAGRPLGTDELAGTSAAWDDADPVLAYAATLLVAVATPARLLLAQLGDGDLFVVGADGQVRAPLPLDPASVAGTTSTLMQPDAVAATRIRVLDLVVDPVDIVSLSSDGYGNAFADPGWQDRVGRDVRAQVLVDGTATVRSRIAGWVADAAAVGGDDASLALLVRGGRWAG